MDTPRKVSANLAQQAVDQAKNEQAEAIKNQQAYASQNKPLKEVNQVQSSQMATLEAKYSAQVQEMARLQEIVSLRGEFETAELVEDQ